MPHTECGFNVRYARAGSALIGSARTGPRFETTRQVASKENGDTSPRSQLRHYPRAVPRDNFDAIRSNQR